MGTWLVYKVLHQLRSHNFVIQITSFIAKKKLDEKHSKQYTNILNTQKAFSRLTNLNKKAVIVAL